MRKRDLVSWELKNGVRCYSCKEEFPGEMRFERTRKICKKCERDNSLNILFGKKKDVIVLRFKELLLDDRWFKWQRVVMFSTMIISLVGITIEFIAKVETYSGEVTNLLNCLIWVVMIFQLKYSTVKKKTRL